MAFFQIITNIFNLININKYINNFPIFCNILKQNNRTYWFGNLRPLSFNKGHKHISESYEKLPLIRIEPSTGQSSKCLENYNKPIKSKQRLLKFHKSPSAIKEKPTNRKKTKFNITKPSFWQCLFGIKSKKSWPPLYIYPVTYKKQIKLNKQNPIFKSNPSYRSTPENMLIYTEVIKTNKHESSEPQPIPYHPYKLPRAVLCKMIMENTEKKLSYYSAVRSPNHNNCKSNTFQKNPILFKGMRPMEKEKNAFTCEDGVIANNIMQPFNTKMNPYGISFIKLIRNPNHALNKLLQTKLIDNLKILKNIKSSGKISKG